MLKSIITKGIQAISVIAFMVFFYLFMTTTNIAANEFNGAAMMVSIVILVIVTLFGSTEKDCTNF